MDINQTTAPKETIYAPFKPDEEAPYIFISYSHRDRDRVFPIITRLYEKGWRVWYDEGLEVTENYYTSLSRHIKNCTVFLLFLTENSVKSEFVSEHELLLATTMRKRIAICRLDKNAEFEGEAKDAIDIATVSKKNPKTDEAGLIAALEGVDELPRFAPRKAEGIKVEKCDFEDIIAKEVDEYDYVKCFSGIKLTKYKGGDVDVDIPKTYKGQTVVALGETFFLNPNVRSVRIAPTVEDTSYTTFYRCKSLSDIYVPSSVRFLSLDGFDGRLHCAENSPVSLQYENDDRLVFDLSLDIDETKRSDVDFTRHAFCSYASDVKEEVERIVQKLIENGCIVAKAFPMKNKLKSLCYRNARCMIAFLSHGYFTENEIDYLYRAIEGNKPFIIYVLDNSELPDDIDIAQIHDQQLRFDSGTEADRITKLTEWLDKNGCVDHTSLYLPDYEYTTDTDGNVILTRYSGKRNEVVLPGSFHGHPVIAIEGNLDSPFGQRKREITSVTIPNGIKRIGPLAFWGCRELNRISISDSVTLIGPRAFEFCSSLASIDLPDELTEIGKCAFGSCESLTTVIIPDSVERIGDLAFENCNHLVSLTVKGRKTSIGKDAFSGCDKLSVYCHKDSAAWDCCEEHNIPHKPI